MGVPLSIIQFCLDFVHEINQAAIGDPLFMETPISVPPKKIAIPLLKPATSGNGKGNIDKSFGNQNHRFLFINLCDVG